jgi:hypothetical protein
MGDRPKSDVVERIRKLLAKTEDNGCTQAEAESAFKLASRIMAEHNIEMAEIEAKEGVQDDISWLEDEVTETGRWSLEMNLAYGIVKEYFFIEAFFACRYRGRKILKFFGTATNVEAASFTYKALLEAFDRLFRSYRARSGCGADQRRLFVSGVAQGFAHKMRDERRAMEIERDLVQGKATGSTALVLASVQDRTREEFVKDHPDMKSHKANFASVTGSQSTLDAGYAAGRSLNLNRSLGGNASGGRKAIGS